MTDFAARTFGPADFTSLGSNQLNIDVLRDDISSQVYDTSPPFVDAIAARAVIARWGSFPTPADVATVAARIAAHTGGATTSAPVQLENLANVDAPSATMVSIFDHTTPPLKAGTYLVIVATDLWMPATIANTFTRCEFRIGPAAGTLIAGTTAASGPQTHSTAFTPHAMLARTEGQTLRLLLQVAKLGVPAATARASNSRMSYCRVA